MRRWSIDRCHRSGDLEGSPIDHIMTFEKHPIFSGGALNFSNSQQRFFLTANHGSRYVLYQDSTIRWCHVCEENYMFMQVEPSLQDVKSAVLSQSGEFLCLYSDVEIRIVEIPWSYKDVSSMTGAFQKYHHVTQEDNVNIKQVLFHHLAADENTLIILKSDDSISLVDWQSRKDEVILNQHYRTLGIDGIVSDISSLSLSTDGLTLYALNTSEGGDIFAFYPCLPSKLKIGKKELEFLMDKSLVQYDSLDITSQVETKTNTIKQLRFVSSLHKDDSNARSNGSIVLDVSKERRQAKGQGPFTIAPFPDKLYDCTFQEIAVLPVSEDVDLLLLSMDDGTIGILYNDLEIVMNWDFIDYNHNNSFVLIETIKLKEPGKILVPTTQYGIFSISNGSKTYLIDTTRWSKKMANSIKDADLQILEEIDFKSDVKLVEATSSTNSVSFCSSLEAECLVFVSDKSVFCEQLGSKSLESKKEDKRQPERSSSYKTHFTQPINEIMTLNQMFQNEVRKSPNVLLDPQTRQQPLANESNEKQLTALTEVSKDLMARIAKGQSLGFMLHNRLMEQQYELTSQLKVGNDILARQAVVEATHQRQASSRERLMTRQKSLSERLNGLKDRITRIEDSSRYRDMKINRKEREWFIEIKNQVINFNQYVHTQRNLQDELQYVTHELSRTTKNTAEDQSFDDWEQLREMLEEDTKILKDCNIQLTHASTELHNNTKSM